jgi:DNA-binding MarR family transcriptional regulator
MNREMIEQVATRLDLAAAQLVRQTRRETGTLSAARLGALSAIVARGPLSLKDLAAAQKVRAPTMSRIVDALVRDGLISREQDPANRRSIKIAATDQGATLVRQGQKDNMRVLATRLTRLGDSERRALLRGVELIERLARG